MGLLRTGRAGVSVLADSSTLLLGVIGAGAAGVLVLAGGPFAVGAAPVDGDGGTAQLLRLQASSKAAQVSPGDRAKAWRFVVIGIVGIPDSRRA